jgi:orotate phosphoribosyltransferase
VVDRSGGRVQFDVPLRALISQAYGTYAAGECPLCRAGKPVEKPGSRPPTPQRQGPPG